MQQTCCREWVPILRVATRRRRAVGFLATARNILQISHACPFPVKKIVVCALGLFCRLRCGDAALACVFHPVREVVRVSSTAPVLVWSSA